ncbi:MAG: methyltransferase domain-containing protein [Lachnospiraceae bacterium]|nr:methyltransferase domain-containing protein [Lachnospiraceae bacterium]
MEAYTSFASVYDTFMDNVPYGEWGGYIYTLLCRYGVKSGIILDLGCGTGTITEILAGYGYDMIGVDNSEDMLELAMEKRIASGHDILYLLQDMREFELYGTVRAVVSVCDSVNYITEPEELAGVFRLVNNYLDPGGIFIFDFNTEYKYREVMGDCTIAEDRGPCSFIWDNCYYEEERINEYDLTLFIREGTAPGQNEGAEEDDTEENGALYRKYTETHFQRGYTLEEIRELLSSAGLIFQAAYDMDTREAAGEKSERVCVIARECGKQPAEKTGPVQTGGNR